MSELFLPESEAELGDMLRAAADSGEALRVQGGGTLAGFGHPVTADRTLSTLRLDGILDYEPSELVMTAHAGTPLAEIVRVLAEHRQHLAFEPPRLGRLYGREPGNPTIGGVFMANLSGPRRFRAGAARDHLLGLRAVSGRAEIWKTGGRVIKNVTGYDLGKLMAGSWGTLAVATELSFKVLPAPTCTRSLVFPVAGTAAGFELVALLARSPLDFSGLALIPEAAAARLPGNLVRGMPLVVARLEGTAVSVVARHETAARMNDAAECRVIDGEAALATWEAIRDVAALLGDGVHPVIFKVSAPPAAMPAAVQLLEPGLTWYSDCAAGWLWAGTDAAGASRIIPHLRESLAGTGSVVIYSATEEIKSALGVYSNRAPALAALSGRIKQGFDPAGILNPGRLYPH